MAILIKRYANRKLYNTDTSRYITLKGIAKLLDDGEEVRVVDNETGDDITQIALSQILVDNKRANEDPSDTLLTQILSRGGDALYGAIRKSVDDATDGIGDFQDRFRKLVGQSATDPRAGLGFLWDRPSGKEHARDEDGDASESREAESHDLDRLVYESVERAVKALDLPTRRDLAALNQKFERVAKAVERLERAYLPDDKVPTQPSADTDRATSK